MIRRTSRTTQQEIIRRRTQQDIIRQQQEQLKRETIPLKEAPQLQQEATAEQIAEFNQAKQSYEKEIERASEYNRAVQVLNKLISKGKWGVIGQEARFGTPAMRSLSKKVLTTRERLQEIKPKISEQAKRMSEISIQLGGTATPEQVQANLDLLKQGIIPPTSIPISVEALKQQFAEATTPKYTGIKKYAFEKGRELAKKDIVIGETPVEKAVSVSLNLLGKTEQEKQATILLLRKIDKYKAEAEKRAIKEGKVPSLKPPTTTETEKKFSVMASISDAYWKASEFLGKQMIETFKKAGIPTRLLEKEIKLPGWVKSIPGHFALWILFSPAMKSGAMTQELMYAGKTKLVYDYVKGKWVKVDAVTGKIIPEMTRAEALGEFGRLPEKRQLEILKKAFQNVKDESGNILKRVYLDKASLLKDIEKSKDFMRGAGLTEAQIESRINLLFPALKPKPSLQIQIQAEMPQQLTGIDWLGGGASAIRGTVQAEKVGVPEIASVLQQPNIFFTGLKTKQKQLQLQKQLFFQKLAQPLLFKQQQRQRSRLLSLFAQPQALRQPSLLRQPSALAQPSLFKQPSLLKQPSQLFFRQPTRTIPKQPTKPGVKLPKPPPKIPKFPPLPSGVTETKLVKALQIVGKGGINVVVGMKLGKQKIIGRNLPPYKALKKASRYVDENIQASFKLVKSGKKHKGKDIKPFNIGRKFRGSKRDPLFQVEKRKFRLDSPGERKQIQMFRGSVPKGFFSSKPTKRRKRKKK